MTRVLYESQQDRDNEQALGDIVRRHYDCELHKMPIKLNLDFLATRNGEGVAFVEMRNRRNKMHAFPTYMVSLYKCMMAKKLTDATGLPSFLAVQWSDASGICRLPADDASVQIGGSLRRGDTQDIEPVCYIPMSSFRVLA